MAYDEVLAQRIHDPADGHAVRPMEMRGREMADWLLVSQDALSPDEQLELWVERGATYVRTLPPR